MAELGLFRYRVTACYIITLFELDRPRLISDPCHPVLNPIDLTKVDGLYSPSLPLLNFAFRPSN